MGLLLIGLAAIQWARKLMTDREIVDERHDASSTPEDRAEAVARIKAAGSDVTSVKRV